MQKCLRRIRFGAAMLCVSLSWAPNLRAQSPSDDATRAVARELGVEGIQAYQANEVSTADQKLEKAYRLFAAPTLGLWSARSRAKLGRLVEAAERYRQVIQISPADVGELEPQRAAQAEAAQELKELLPRIPMLTVVLQGAAPSDVKLTLDDKSYPSDLLGIARPTNPGAHRLIATRGAETVEQAVELKEKEQKSVPLAFRTEVAAIPAAEGSEPTTPAITPALAATSVAGVDGPVEQPNLWKPVGIAALSVGAAGLIVWGVSSLIADKKLDACPQRDSEHVCTTESKASAYRTPKSISTVSFWSGAALVVGGASALLIGARSPASESKAVSLGVGPTGVSLHGKF